MGYEGETETAPVPGHVVAPVPASVGLAGSTMMSPALFKPTKRCCTLGSWHEAASGKLDVGVGVEVGVCVSGAEGLGNAPVDKVAVGLGVAVAETEAVCEGCV